MPGPIARVILFTSDMKKASAFYRDALGFKPIIDPAIPADEWIEFQAGRVTIALHRAGKGRASAGGGCRHKIVFFAKDVAKARAKLVKKMVKVGPVKTWGKLSICDFSDPEGNRMQISNR